MKYDVNLTKKDCSHSRGNENGSANPGRPPEGSPPHFGVGGRHRSLFLFSLHVAIRAFKGVKTGFNSYSEYVSIRVNDPSAGSPTETLLRLLLPLDD
jgi:hypothetical protein